MATRKQSATNGHNGWIPSWMRRTVPAGYQSAVLTLAGTSPLLMNCDEYDRDAELYRSYYMLGKKKGKSLDDEKRMRKLNWQLALYFDDDIGVYWPGKNIHELLRSAATKWRKGEDVKRSLVVLDSRLPLVYDGPSTQEELWEQRFKDERMVQNAGVGSGRVVRARPKFKTWSLIAELAYDPEDLDFDFLGLVVERSQKYGIGDYRPYFGAFVAWLELGDLQKLDVNLNAAKPRDEAYEHAHAAFRNRIMAGASA